MPQKFETAVHCSSSFIDLVFNVVVVKCLPQSINDLSAACIVIDLQIVLAENQHVDEEVAEPL